MLSLLKYFRSFLLHPHSMKRVFLSVWLLAVFSGCDTNLETWQGFYYPQGEGLGPNRSEWVYSDPYRTRGECDAWAKRTLQEKKNGGVSCGKNCKPTDNGFNCAETVAVDITNE